MVRFWSMSRRYTYQPRMTARELSQAMHQLNLTSGQLARISGAQINRIQRWLKDQDDIPVYIQRDMYVWTRNKDAYELAVLWANQHAHDVRDDDEGDR